VDSLTLVERNASDPTLAEQARQVLVALESALEEREHELAARRSHAVDGHGDLQLAHVWFEASSDTPSIIDCVEFNRDLRQIDAASEVAFFAMDLAYRGHPELGERFLARYARESDDFGIYSVSSIYQCYRAAVRSKVAVLATLDDEIEVAQRSAALESARSHLSLAARYLERPPPGALILLTGVVGCGKSTVARALAEGLHAVVVSSDRTRKQLEGLRAEDRRGVGEDPGTGLYSDEQKDRVYEALLERAHPILESGRSAVLDASFPTAARRRRALDWAREHARAVRLVHVECAPDIARQWLDRRERGGQDPSDAGPGLYDWSVRSYESPAEWPADSLLRVRTDSPTGLADLMGNPSLPPAYSLPS
jgi:predicted kinase